MKYLVYDVKKGNITCSVLSGVVEHLFRANKKYGSKTVTKKQLYAILAPCKKGNEVHFLHYEITLA